MARVRPVPWWPALSDLLTVVFPGEIDRGRMEASFAELLTEGGAWTGIGAPEFDPSVTLGTLASVVARYGSLRPGECRCSRALDDRYDRGREPESLTTVTERLAKVRNELEWFAPDFLARIQSAKSLTRGCQECGSQVAVRYLKVRDDGDGSPRTVDCPVCGTRDFCLPPGDRARKDTLTIRLAELEASSEATALREAKRRGSQVWVVCARPPLPEGDGRVPAT